MNTYDYRISRTVNAPVAKVWTAWTDAEQFAGVFHAVPGSVELDVRPGGVWKAAMVSPDGGVHSLTGHYVNVVPNERLELAMDIPGAEPQPMGLELTDAGNGTTEVVLTQSLASEQERDMAKEGSEMLLAWCAEYVETI